MEVFAVDFHTIGEYSGAILNLDALCNKKSPIKNCRLNRYAGDLLSWTDSRSQ